MGKRGLRNLGLDLAAWEAVMLNRVEEKLPSASDIVKADDRAPRDCKSTEDLITQGQEMLPMCELLGLDKQLRSIKGSLKVEVAKKVQLEESIKKGQVQARGITRPSWSL